MLLHGLRCLPHNLDLARRRILCQDLHSLSSAYSDIIVTCIRLRIDLTLDEPLCSSWRKLLITIDRQWFDAKGNYLLILVLLSKSVVKLIGWASIASESLLGLV